MSTPKSPARRKLDELLADGNWHPLETAITALMPHVPPGRATRKTANQRAHRRAGTDTRPNRRNDDIQVGARAIARSTIAIAVTRGTVERDGNHIRRAR